MAEEGHTKGNEYMTEYTLLDDFLSYESIRAVDYLRRKKISYTVYGTARSCKAVLDGDRWEPADYTADGKTTAQNGVDVIVFPLLQNGEVVNLLAFEPNKPMALYLRKPDCNLWSLLELIDMMRS